MFKYGLAILMATLLLGIANQFSPYKILYSPQVSISKGFYFSSPCTKLELETRGTMVSFSYQQEDWLPSGVVSNYKRLTKFMVGIKGDVVSLGENTTTLCDKNNCKTYERIPEMPINVVVGKIKEGEFFGVATASDSFDSRYAGNFKKSSILGCLIKL